MFENVVSNIKPGSIIVFHDSVKAFKKNTHITKVLEYLDKKLFNVKLFNRIKIKSITIALVLYL
jgi:hypothetical protein